MNKKIMFLIAMVVLVIGLVACGKKEEEVKPVQSGETVVVVSGESESKPVAKETNPYVANIPNEILDFYKEKVEAIEEANKKENEALLKENPDLKNEIEQKVRKFYDIDLNSKEKENKGSNN